MMDDEKGMREYNMEYAEVHFQPFDTFAKAGGMWPSRIGRMRAKSNYKRGPAQISHYSLHFVLNGLVQLTYDNDKIVLGKGDVFCKFPNTTYVYEVVASDAPLQMKWFSLDGEQMVSLLEMIGVTSKRPYRQKAIQTEVEIALNRAFQISQSTDKQHRLGLYSSIFRIFSLLSTEETEVQSANTPEKWVQKSLDFIKEYYNEQVTVADVARFIGFHRTYFTKFFTQIVGVPPAKYIQELRLSKGKQMLQHTRLSVTEIALSIGYPDLYSFTRSFTKKYGCSPKEMRKLHYDK